MAISVYQIKSPLSQVSEEQSLGYLNALAALLPEPLVRVDIDGLVASNFGLVYIASGGSEGFFKEILPRIKDRPCYLLASNDSNSLAASMEILSYLQQHGYAGEILHGDDAAVAARIRALSAAVKAKAALSGLRIGVVGKPSDWLIASDCDEKAYADKLGAKVVGIPMEELIGAVADKMGFNPLFIAMGFFDLIGAVFLVALIAERRNPAKRESL